MLKNIILSLFIVLVFMLVLASRGKDYFTVKRMIVIKAPPEKIYPYIIDFRKWGQWSPYEKFDKGMKRTYTGPKTGKGSVYAWAGNEKAGAGKMEIQETISMKKVVIKIDFLKPMETSNTIEFTLDGGKGYTEVIWAMKGRNNYMAKLMQMFVSMDRLVGGDFETGLMNLKKAVEK